jgi:hypothetical protein
MNMNEFAVNMHGPHDLQPGLYGRERIRRWTTEPATRDRFPVGFFFFFNFGGLG